MHGTLHGDMYIHVFYIMAYTIKDLVDVYRHSEFHFYIQYMYVHIVHTPLPSTPHTNESTHLHDIYM